MNTTPESQAQAHLRVHYFFIVILMEQFHWNGLNIQYCERHFWISCEFMHSLYWAEKIK